MRGQRERRTTTGLWLSGLDDGGTDTEEAGGGVGLEGKPRIFTKDTLRLGGLRVVSVGLSQMQ